MSFTREELLERKENMILQSENIGEIAKALAKAQANMGKASKASTNPYFKSKYADLNEVIDVTREDLTSNGIAVIQNATDINGVPYLVCTLAHESGQWIRGAYPIQPSKQNDPQALGACLTYLRRYSLASMVGLAQEDDDGNKASGRNTKDPEVIGDMGAQKLQHEMANMGYSLDEMLELGKEIRGTKISTLGQLSKDEANKVFMRGKKKLGDAKA